MAKRPSRTALSLPSERIERRIFFTRGQKVMLDADLAGLYQVETKNLNRAVKRNLGRFPADFMFRLTAEEAANLRCQIGTSSSEAPTTAQKSEAATTVHGGRRTLPYAFTEQGVAMLSSVLSSRRAVQVNISIMRAFVRLREYMAAHKELAQEIREMQRTQKEHGDHIKAIWEAIQELVEPPPVKPKRRIGFQAHGS